MTFKEICKAAVEAFWSTLTSTRSNVQAVSAFWAALPSLPKGDLPFDAAISFHEAWERAHALGKSDSSEAAFAAAAEDAIRTLLHFNLPTGTIIQMEDGFKLHNVDGAYTNGDLTYASIFKIDLDFTILSIPEKETLPPGDIVLPRTEVVRLLAEQEEKVNPNNIGYYSSIEELAAKTSSSKNWSIGEVFVYAPAPDRYLIMCQVAPASCEMLTMSASGPHDVLTAYRYPRQQLVDTLHKFVNC